MSLKPLDTQNETNPIVKDKSTLVCEHKNVTNETENELAKLLKKGGKLMN